MKNLFITLIFLMVTDPPHAHEVKKKLRIEKDKEAFIAEINNIFFNSDVSKISPRIIKDINENFSKKSVENVENEGDEPCKKTIDDVIHDRYMSDRCNTIIYKSPDLKKYAHEKKKCPVKLLSLGKNSESGELRGMMNHEGNKLAILWYLDNC